MIGRGWLCGCRGCLAGKLYDCFGVLWLFWRFMVVLVVFGVALSDLGCYFRCHRKFLAAMLDVIGGFWLFYSENRVYD